LAEKIGISRSEMELRSNAFRLARTW